MSAEKSPSRPGIVELTGAEVLVRLLEAEGVPYAFGIVGGKLAPLLHALSRSRIPFVGVRHEATGPMMAAAVHAASGQVAVALGEMGPGGLNLASGAGVAFNNNLAVLLITTNQHRAAAYPHAGMFMDLDLRAVLAPLTKWNAVVHDARRIPELVRTAFRQALSGRPGPVHLDFPQDVLSSVCRFAADELGVAPARYRAVSRPRPAARDIDAAAALLRASRRPLVVAGGGVVASGAAPALRALASRLGAPVVPTQMALGVAASDSPHFIGHGGLIAGDAVQHAFDEADVIVSIGCRFSSWMWDARGALARRHHRLININIDASALGSPALHEVAMQADAGHALDDLLHALGERPALAVNADWLPRLRSVRAGYEAALAVMASDTGATMHPAALAQAVGQALPRDALAVFDGGHTTFWSNDLTPVHDVRTRFHEPGMCQLGFGAEGHPPRQAGRQHHRRRCIRLHAAGARQCAPQRPARGQHHPQQRRVGHHPRRPAPATRLRARHRAGRHRLRRDRARLRLLRRDRRARRRRRARAAAGARERPACGARLPHQVHSPSCHARVRQHEPLRLRCAHRRGGRSCAMKCHRASVA